MNTQKSNDMIISSEKDALTTESSHPVSPRQLGNITTRRRLPAYRRIVQNIPILWLNPNIYESQDGFRDSIVQLQHIFNDITVFNDADRFVDFLTEIKHEKTCMIVSNDVGQHVVPLIHDAPQLDAIYIVSETKTTQREWTKNWSKVRGIFTEIQHVCESLERAAIICDQNSISINIISLSDALHQNLDQLDQSFMYTQLLKEILLEFPYSERSLEILVDHCRDQYTDNDFELKKIDEFFRDYRLKSPIFWYTYATFIYYMLNQALRTQEVGSIITMGVFVRDLHKNIEQLHSEQSNGHKTGSFVVYRGQGVSNYDFEKIKRSEGGLLSFNSFLSTSIDHDVSFAFADSNRGNPDLVGILFHITIDPLVSSIPFASLDNVSHFTSEKEILFSMHSVFRIGEIKRIYDDDRFWQVELTLTKDNDQQLWALTERIREETESESKPHQLGQFLIKLGQFNKAKQLYKALLDLMPDDIQKATVCHQLGYIHYSQGDFVNAISFHEQSLQIKQQTFSTAHLSLADSYNSIGAVYDDMGEYSKALSFFEKALEICNKKQPPNLDDLNKLYNNMGGVFDKMGEYSKALSFFEKALEIRQITLPQNHPDLAQSFNNIGGLYYNMGEYSKAMASHQTALDINEKILPSNHPSLAISYNNMGTVYYEMKEYKKALVYYRQACKIYQQIHPPDHPALATSYSNIGSALDCMGMYSQAILFHEKALAIDQKALPPYHPSLAINYNNHSAVYSSMGEYSKALFYSEKALEVYQKTLSPNHPLLVNAYNNIGFIYNKMGEYSKALSFYGRGIEVAQHSLPSNHPNLQNLQENIDSVKNKL
ncbi:unnamed protein product [Rotaria magnacalcarata]|uniref:ADP ribosyltransferase domain-containing protein n=1 Tax=Rotaria magnacalcarata TaxID=392030 RepID=A0A820C782_9BILA|nr:unnamed protein product [Rotaria magnacalcarata]CAF4211426.1 unnamed protein product [Rotaria magnacalcarata]